MGPRDSLSVQPFGWALGNELQFWLDFTIKFISLFYDLILGESSRQSPRHGSQTALSSDMAHG